MRKGGGALVALLLLVCAMPARPAAAALATVDHPPTDGVHSIDNGPRWLPRVALTFDADMTPGMLHQLRAGQVRSWYNQEVRDILDSEGVPATVFLTGLWAETYPDVARSMAEDPLLEIANHTYDHMAFRTPCYGLPQAGDRGAEIARAQESIRQATGVTPTLVRFPGDCYNGSDVALADSMGLTVISGDDRSGDAFSRSPAAIVLTTMARLQAGSIVLMHIHGGPNAPMTAPALRQVIQAVRARGLQFVKVSELLLRSPAAPPQPPDPPDPPAAPGLALEP